MFQTQRSQRFFLHSASLNALIFKMAGVLLSQAVLISALYGVPKNSSPKIEELAKVGNWTAYKMTKGDQTFCYMHTTPITSKGSYQKRGAVNLLITHIPQNKHLNVVEFQAGYPYHPKKEVLSIVAGKTYILFADGEGAWCQPDGISDNQLTKAILTNTGHLVLKGTSRKGTETEDTFSLAGATTAYRAICQACRVQDLFTRKPASNDAKKQGYKK